MAMTEQEIAMLKPAFIDTINSIGEKYVANHPKWTEDKMDKKEPTLVMLGTMLGMSKPEAEEVLGVGILEAVEKAA